ncbi:hypothetical protein [Myxococcus landrumensis]|uniref:Uncharacterized protein n=1 Tax=Myxococcus landrumensis TaxID=2813577 RepID=A0ABX7N8Z5_9BACT|nr:hypothetical protein [Myxococcus landrumus]QSQ13891.1 hypothetical protein JY572_37155 [Myxococcus landrumus]
MATEPEKRRPAVRAPAVSLVLGLMAALVPKCPLCLVAYLPVLGVTVGAAGALSAMLRPAGFAVAALSLGFIGVRHMRKRTSIRRARQRTT